MTDRKHLLKRRELLQLGIGGISALGAAALPVATVETQTPGSGQGPQPPQPPTPDDRCRRDADDRRGLDRAVDLAALRLARSAAGPERRRQCTPAARDLAGQPLHAALQLQRVEPGAHDSPARRRRASRDAQKSPRSESEPRAERTRGRPVRGAPRRARRRVLPDAEGSGRARVSRRRTREPSSATSTSSSKAARSSSSTPAASRVTSTCRTARIRRTCTRTACTSNPASTRTARSATTPSCASCRVPTGTPASRRPTPAADARAARARRRSAVRTSARQRAAVAPAARRAGAAAPARHALVSPARARLDARSGGERPRRVPHRRRRRRRRDQPGDDGERSSGSVRQDRARTTIASV